MALLIYGYYLFRRINSYKKTVVLLNDENKWFLKESENTYKIRLKDYWILNKHLFIWLKGSNKSISLMISRSIIGPHNYSLIRSKLK